jgi:2-oxoglutarate ferredoxin oxidoreductase subunit alpha
VLRLCDEPTRFGVLYYGSTSPAMREALDVLEAEGTLLDALRLRAFPFPQVVPDFILAHEQVFVVEQNRDGQMRSLLVNELGIDPLRLPPVLHYDGTPITARFIAAAIRKAIGARNATPAPARTAAQEAA